VTEEELARLERRAVQLRKSEALGLIAAVREARAEVERLKAQILTNNAEWEMQYEAKAEMVERLQAEAERLRTEGGGVNGSDARPL
jgi:F0F1-type ATP synthase epsilon subunit